MFFLEKKNQKTFCRFACVPEQRAPDAGKRIKVFLLLVLQKQKTLP